MHAYRKPLGGYRLIFGLLGLSAIVTEVVTLIERGIFNPNNFYSYFTIQSNLFAAIILMTAGIAALRSKTITGLAMWRGAATVYMATTGLVFSVLLSGLDPGVLTAVPWDNIVLHYIIPFAVMADWLLEPPRERIPLRRAAVWLVYPFSYLAYSLLRGNAVGWYPYPFLNPANNGYAGVGLVCAGIAVTLVVLTWFVVRVGAWRRG